MHMKKFLISVIGCFIALSCVVTSCRQVCPPTETEILARQVKEYAQLHPDGFTIHLPDWSVPDSGIVVSYAATQGTNKENMIVAVVEHALQHDSLVGGWFNSQDSMYYYDSCRLFPEDSLDAAMAFGIENKQIAIFVLSCDSSIYLQKK